MSSSHIEKIYDRKVIEEKMKTSFSSSLDRLEFFWKAFGISTEKTEERANLVLGHLTALLNECEKEEENLYESLKARISKYLEELREIAEELDVTPVEPDENLSLLEKEKLLRTQLDELGQERHNRLKDYKQLLRREGKLCEMLGMPKSVPPATAVPKKQDLAELEQHIHMLTDERERRYQKFCSAKRELTTIIEVTEFLPETSFEREVICFDNEETLVLSRENLEQMNQLVKKFQQRMVEMKREKDRLLDKLQSLWDRLNVDEMHRHTFLSMNSTLRQTVLSAMKQEIERCEEIKRENIGHYIGKLRAELVDLWEKCYINDQVREHFEAFHDDNFTEELLELHETEVDKMKRYHEETKTIYEKIQQRQKLWDLMLVFEKKARDPNRFTNRGGNLLQEERERRKLLKELPKLEEEILQAIEEYEERNDKIFLVKGVNFAEFIKSQWEDHLKEKEKEKQERRQRTMQQECVTPASKRPIGFGTPATAPSKLMRTNTGLSVLRNTNISRARTPTMFTPMNLRKRNNENTVQQRRSARMRQAKMSSTPMKGILVERNAVCDSANNTTSYSQFATELNKQDRSRCRSSVLAARKKVICTKANRSGSSYRKSSSRSSRKSSSIHSSSSKSKTPKSKSSNKSLRGTSRTPTKITPARGKLGLPFLL